MPTRVPVPGRLRTARLVLDVLAVLGAVLIFATEHPLLGAALCLGGALGVVAVQMRIFAVQRENTSPET